MLISKSLKPYEFQAFCFYIFLLLIFIFGRKYGWSGSLALLQTLNTWALKNETFSKFCKYIYIYIVRSACKLRARRTVYKSVFFFHTT